MKIDLHVHSKYSEPLSELFLRKLGAAESYTEPEFIYRTAKERGMDLVTITDHNRIEGVMALKQAHPSDVITGVESTVYFPEDQCPLHLLIYGFDESQFREIQKLRKDIYALRAYLIEQDLACAVAHASYSRNPRLTIDKLEKLVLMFDLFEGINGGIGENKNRTWSAALAGLTPGEIDRFSRTHGIVPRGDRPWVKGITGGSDDHSGLFIARTWTNAPGTGTDGLLASLKNRATTAGGRSSEFHSLAFTLFKIGNDFAKNSAKGRTPHWQRAAEIILEGKPLRFREKLALKKLRFETRRREDRIKSLILDMTEENSEVSPSLPVEERLDRLYDRIAELTDETVLQSLKTLGTTLKKGDFTRASNSITATLAGIIATVPFAAAFRYMHTGRELNAAVCERFAGARATGRTVLWFADGSTVYLLRGDAGAEPERIDLPRLHTLKLPWFGEEAIAIPSFLKALKTVYRCNPDEIWISTLTPAALFALGLARLMDIKTVMRHPEENLRAMAGSIEAPSIAGLFERYLHWLYGAVDEIRVDSAQGMETVESMGMQPTWSDLNRNGSGRLPGYPAQ